MLIILPDFRVSQARKFFRNILGPNTGMSSFLFLELRTFKGEKNKKQLDTTNVLFFDLGVVPKCVHFVLIH